jgi:hypothetical protein
MKNKNYLLFTLLFCMAAYSCNRKAGKIPNLQYRLNTGYMVGNFSIDPATPYKIGIIASESENGDKLKHFTVTKSVNDSAATIETDIAIPDTAKSYYTYEIANTSSTIKGRKVVFTFTVTAENDVSNWLATTFYVK